MHVTEKNYIKYDKSCMHIKAGSCQYILHIFVQSLTAKTIELDNLKAEWTARLNDQMAKHKQEMAGEKERIYQV